jgi:GT2 family glycosyltransferase
VSFGIVVVGRNEGERLKRCLKSFPAATAIIYVDSGSTDGSAQWARKFGASVVDLDMSLPFTAARARNAGFRRLRELAPDVCYVQFVDGDCELVEGWMEQASSFLDLHADAAAVCGLLRERYPDRSVYNWLCDREWNGRPGDVRAFGGIVMIRADALEASGGFREDMIAGEEPELGVRLRAAGWRLRRLDAEMALHDAAMTRFRQWWRRAYRTGYAFAHGAHLHGAPPERHCIWDFRRALFWGLWLPLACLLIGIAFPPWGWTAWLTYPLQLVRQMLRNSGSLEERAIAAVFQVLARFPEALGELKFMGDSLLGRRSRLIEHR